MAEKQGTVDHSEARLSGLMISDKAGYRPLALFSNAQDPRNTVSGCFRAGSLMLPTTAKEP